MPDDHESTPMATDTRDDPWDGMVDSTHLVGDLYLITRFKRRYWAITTILLIAVPPLGAFLAAYMAVACIHTSDADLDGQLTADPPTD